MQEIVYGDILFIINFSMDFLILFLTGKILHRKINTLSLVMASAVGAGYAVFSLFLNGNGVITFLINIGVSALIVYIAFGAEKIFGYFKSLILFYCVSFVTGGGITAIYNLFNSYKNSQKIYINGNINSIVSDIPASRFVILAIVSLILAFVFGRVFNRKSKIKSAVVTAIFKGNLITFEGLSDSGNLLKEPISGMPVIVTKYETLKPLLPNELHAVFENHDTDRLFDLDFSLIRRVKVIPMSTVGHEGILMGFVPEKLVVDGVYIEACIAADTSSKLNDSYGEYDAVLPAVLIDS